MHSPQPATRDTAPSREPASDSRPLSRLSKGPSDRRHTPAASDPWGGRMTPPTPPLRGRDRGTTADSSKLSKLRTSAKLFFALVPRPHLLPSGPRLSSRATPSYHLLAWSHSLTLARPPPPPLLSSALRVHLFPSSHCPPSFSQVLLSPTHRPTQLRCLAPQGARTSKQFPPNPPQLRTCPAPGHRSRPTSSTFRHRA